MNILPFVQARINHHSFLRWTAENPHPVNVGMAYSLGETHHELPWNSLDGRLMLTALSA